MATARRFVLRIVAFLRFDRAEHELAREVASSLALMEDELRGKGMTSEDARLAARRAFGGVEQAKERHRDERSFAWLDDARRDVAYALRTLRRAPGFAAAAILTLALGVGTNAAIFSVVNAVLVRPLPFRAPDRLVQLWETPPQGNRPNVVSPGNFFDWQEQAASFEAIGAYTGSFGMAMTRSGQPARVETSRMTASALRALGVDPVVGRLFDTPEIAPAAEAGEILISRAFWRQRFRADVAAVGSVILLNDRPYTIVGVMPAGFDFPTPKVEAWMPATFPASDRNERRSHNWRVVARLKDSVSIQAAEGELKAIAAKNARLYPETMEGWSAKAVPLHRDMVGEVEPLLVTLAALALTVLLAACANLASLLLARARRRETEFALRSAVGAGRVRILRQIVTEVIVLAVIGGALGMTLVAAMLPALLAAVPADIPLIQHVSIDPTVVAVAAGLTLLTALAVGLAPALRIARRDLRPALQAARVHGDVQTGRIRGVLLGAQFALSIVLVIAAGLLVRSFGRLAAVDYGFDPGGLAEASLDLPAARYADQPSQERFYAELLDRARALPGVVSAALASDPPLYGNSMTFSFAIDGKPATNPSGRENPVNLVAVSSAYFETLRVPVIQGRAIGEADRRGAAPVLAINRTLANRFWPDSTAVGHHLSFVGPGGPWYEIVGVVGDTKDDGLDKPVPPTLFVPYKQRGPNWTWLSWEVLVVRARPGVDPASLASALRDTVWKVDPDLPLLSFDTVDALYAENAARRRFAMQLATGFAVLALLLSVFGLYGVVSYAVGEREQEIGVRLALGGRPGQILAPVMATGMAPAVAGVALGALGAAGLTRFLEPVLFGVSPTDLATFAGMIALLLAVAAAAAWVPARRATLIDPARSLRGE
jgi:putative ABC transport system permease protein